VDQATFESQSFFDQINLSQAHATGMSGVGVTVAVLDTGIAPNHPYFAGRLVAGRDFVDDDWDATDPGSSMASAERPRASGHGTHISGIILRMAPNSQIMPVRVLDENGRGSSFVIAYAIEWAVAQGADVINLSLGTEYESKVMADVVKYATREGVTIVAAAGNLGTSTPQYPANFKDAISVAAVDGNNVKPAFANYGKWIDLSAPGVGIYSAMTAAEGAGFANWSGSSIATAFVSGAAALLHQKYAGFNGNKANQIENDLLRTAGDLNGANPNYKNELGGLLNVGGAVNR
jgi:thermitase